MAETCDEPVVHRGSEGSTLRIVSYNIHRCIGHDRLYDPGRIREVLHQLDPDVVALQEVELFRSDESLLEFLCERSGWTAVEGFTVERKSGRYGNAVLSRLPILSENHLDLSQSGREARGAIDLCLELPSGAQMNLLATHLGLKSWERRAQAQLLCDHMDGQQRSGPDSVSRVLVGDFNVWTPRSRTLRRLHRYFTPVTTPSAFPARRPILTLDRVWVSPDHVLRSIRTENTALTRLASDHLPLVADLDLSTLE